MGKIFTVIFLSIILNVSGQTTAPKFINYQGIARNANGNPIIAPFDVRFTITNPTTTVHIETQNNIQPNQFGVFNTLIGSASSLTLTAWNSGPFQLNVQINTGSGFTNVGTQQLTSVPFSLFAGDVPTSYTNNILTIGANSYNISSASAASPTIYGTGAAVVSPTTGNTFTVDVAPATLNFSGNTLIFNQGPTGTSAVFTPTLGGDVTGQITTTTVTALRNIPVSNITPTNGQSLFFNGSAWTPSSTPVPTLAPAAWTKGATTVTLATPSDNVGIGLSAPLNKLSVLTSSAAAAIFGFNTGSANNTLSNGITGKTDNNNNTAAGIYGENSGNGYGVYGINTNSVGINPIGVYGKTTNTTTAGTGVIGENSGSGPSVLGINFSGAGSSIQGVQQGSGIAVHGIKSPGSTSGNAGKFENLNSSNAADAVFATSAGVGAAVHAASSPTLGTSALALLIENGHVSTTATAPTPTTITSLAAGGTLGLLNTSTDIAGRINITFGGGPFTAGTYVGINFNKAYVNPPIVILTPASAAAATANVYVNSSTSGFTITHTSTPGAGAVQNFNYIVIETK
jgi:hypothetical protein